MPPFDSPIGCNRPDPIGTIISKETALFTLFHFGSWDRMIFYKLMQSDERLDITIPAVEAISLLERLKRAERAVDSSRSHLDRETMIKLFLNRPGLSSLQRILGQSSTPEDDIDFLDTEGTIDAIRTTGYELITIASLLLISVIFNIYFLAE